MSYQFYEIQLSEDLQWIEKEDLKSYRKSENGDISLGDQQAYYLQVFQGLH